MLFTRYIRTLKPYIDDYYFCVVKMEEMFAIAASFGKIVRNRGFSLRAAPLFFLAKTPF